MSIFCQGPACSTGQHCVATLGVDKQDELSVGTPLPGAGRQYGTSGGGGASLPKTWKTMPVLEASRNKDAARPLDDMSIGFSEPDEGWELLEQAVAEASPEQRERLEIMLRRKRQGAADAAAADAELSAAQSDAQKRSLEFNETMQALSNLRQSLARQPEPPAAAKAAGQPRTLRPQMPPGSPSGSEPPRLLSPRALQAARNQDAVRAAAASNQLRLDEQDRSAPIAPVDSMFVNAASQDSGRTPIYVSPQANGRKERSCSPFVMLCADRDKVATTNQTPTRRPSSTERIRTE